MYGLAIFLIINLFNVDQGIAEEPQPYQNCLLDKVRQDARSKELQNIVDEDQKDRVGAPNIPPEQWPDILKRDLKRRQRIGEIFGEGCFKTAADYAAAALVYQHGDQPDHYFQTYVWSKRAVDLGDSSQKLMMAMGIDRYLVNSGKKQLFASQAYRSFNDKCWCLQQIEPTFSDDLRKQYNAKTVKEALAAIDTLNSGNHCPAASECKDMPLASTPQGSVPGLW